MTGLSLARDRHLFGPGPKRILALDGGGVRGAISVAFLERIEAMLRRRHGEETRLCDHFDLVGGTSTGAVIAGALALGFSVAEVKDFYLKLAPQAFKRRRWHVPVLQAKFDARGLRRQIEAVVDGRTLDSPDLKTGLAIVAKRVDTGSPWILSNNPHAPFWEDGFDADGTPYIGNRHYSLATLVRASTAAPHYFDPEIIAIGAREPELPDDVAKPLDRPWPLRLIFAAMERFVIRRTEKMSPETHGLFVDGAVSPHGNPSLALFQLATLSRLGICWPLGPDRLTLVSIGTGGFRPRLAFGELGFARFPRIALHAMTSLMTDAETMVLALMQWMGECPAPWPINSEVGTLAGDALPGGKMFRFLRYDVRLEADWIERELGQRISAHDLARYRGMDDPGIVHEVYELARIAADRQFKLEHWPVASEKSGAASPRAAEPPEVVR